MVPFVDSKQIYKLGMSASLVASFSPRVLSPFSSSAQAFLLNLLSNLSLRDVQPGSRFRPPCNKAAWSTLAATTRIVRFSPPLIGERLSVGTCFRPDYCLFISREKIVRSVQFTSADRTFVAEVVFSQPCDKD